MCSQLAAGEETAAGAVGPGPVFPWSMVAMSGQKGPWPCSPVCSSSIHSKQQQQQQQHPQQTAAIASTTNSSRSSSSSRGTVSMHEHSDPFLVGASWGSGAMFLTHLL
eukprot:scaffold319634_cov21-Tisochrysis_lutea.AAC.1